MGALHTPGPWSIAGPHAQRINYTVLTIGPASGWVCAVPIDVPRAEANARLIAAAPDLLEALIAARKHLDGCTCAPSSGCAAARDRLIIDAAIAKAGAAQ